MREKDIELLIDTDIFISHLTQKKPLDNSALEIALCKGVCFSSVINISELYLNVDNPEEKKKIDSVSKIVKVLGLHSRYSLSIGNFSGKVDSLRDALFCVVAGLNKLTILTENRDRYSRTGLKVITINDLRKLK